jgi:hypothetical protein
MNRTGMAIELEPGLSTTEGIRDALEVALALEHALLPPYLYAYYSLDRDGSTNEEVKRLLKTVAVDEMTHMALVANVLNAIGGAPAIDAPAFVPRYPATLPGGVAVPLAPFSLELARSVFLATASSGAVEAFYGAIIAAIQAAGASIFTGDPDNQAAGIVPVKVTDVASALVALGRIVNGHRTHHDGLTEVVAGTVPFDAATVIPFVSNPTAAAYAGTAAEEPNRQFNADYTSLLQQLHLAFNGAPSRVRGSLTTMFALNADVQELAAVTLDGGMKAGPSFEFTP